MWVRAAVVVALVRLRPLVSIRSIAFGVCEREEAEPALWSCRVPLGVPSGQLGCWFLPLSFFFFFFVTSRRLRRCYAMQPLSP